MAPTPNFNEHLHWQDLGWLKQGDKVSKSMLGGALVLSNYEVYYLLGTNGTVSALSETMDSQHFQTESTHRRESVPKVYLQT
jgi:hypothetical protein